MSSRRKQVVVAAIIERGDYFLVSQRASGAFEGLWEFPGGKRNPSERDKDALRRELREELGVAVEIGAKIYVAKAGPLELRFFSCGWLPTQRPRALASRQFRWVHRPDLGAYRFLPADGELVRRLETGDI